MRFATTIAAAGVAGLLTAGAAQAAPLTVAPVTAPQATLQPAVDSGPALRPILVRGRCGWGAHRTWHGTCHLNYGWRGRVRAWHRWRRW